MILHFKEKQYNWGDSFYIYNDQNQRAYRVKSSVLLWNRKFEIYDLDKNLLATIKKEPKSMVKPKFYIIIDGQEKAAITKEISLVPKYTFEGIPWQMNGVMDHDYELLQDEQEILSIHRESTPWGMRPVLKIQRSSNDLLALAVALTISYVLSAKEGGNSTNHM